MSLALKIHDNQKENNCKVIDFNKFYNLKNNKLNNLPSNSNIILDQFIEQNENLKNELYQTKNEINELKSMMVDFIKNNNTNTKKQKQKKIVQQIYEKYQDEENIKTPVQALKTTEYIQNAKNYFLNKPERFSGQNIRDYSIFVFGINLARRAGDLLHFRLYNVFNKDYSIKTHITIREQKTGKPIKLVMTDTLRNTLELYLPVLQEKYKGSIKFGDPLFPSRNKNKNGGLKAMTVDNFYKKMQKLKKELEIVDPIGTHSLRKTWAFMTVKNNPNDMRIIGKVSKALNHSNIETTFRYLGFEQDEMDETFINNQL